MKLCLVRHAAVTIRPDIPSALWHPSPEGRTAADALAADSAWQAVRIMCASPEPKATGTAQRIAAPHALLIRIDPDLREVERPWIASGYSDLVRSYLAGDPLDGWEPRDAALARIRRCVQRLAQAQTGGAAAVVSHGLLLTLYAADLLTLDAPAAFELWSTIRLPDLAVVDLEAQQLERPFGA